MLPATVNALSPDLACDCRDIKAGELDGTEWIEGDCTKNRIPGLVRSEKTGKLTSKVYSIHETRLR